MNIREHNRKAWNRQVESGNAWTIPVTVGEVASARQGIWEIYLTPTVTVPRTWFPADLTGCRILCLASGGGQQGPLLAAAGASVTVFDNSPQQLERDRLVAKRDGLKIATVEGDMRDLSAFAADSFDLIVHPVSNCFIPDVLSVWRETYRVLRTNGALLAGFNNPARYIFDYEAREQHQAMEVKYRLPYDDTLTHSAKEIQRMLNDGTPLEFSHMLDTLIGGQIVAGFVVAGFYEDVDRPGPGYDILGDYMPLYIATRALKLPDELLLRG